MGPVFKWLSSLFQCTELILLTVRIVNIEQPLVYQSTEKTEIVVG